MTRISTISLFGVAVALGLVACEPVNTSFTDATGAPDAPPTDAVTDGNEQLDAPTDAAVACTPTGPESCSNQVDDDCDGQTDCTDDACAGHNGCAVICGQLGRPEASLALPDGVGVSYTSDLGFTGFTAGQTFADVTTLLGVCVNMEHSWLRDLQIELTCPSGQTTVMQMFAGTMGSELHMGTPDDTDQADPVPGIGADYCWSPAATNPPTLDWANANPGIIALPPGNYLPSTPFDQLIGCPLNGAWTIKITDLWMIDNGFVFSWSIKFDRSIVADCASWPPST